MIFRRTCNVAKDAVFPRLLYSDSRCSEACRQLSQACHWPAQTCRWRSQTCHRRSWTYSQRSQTCRRRSQAGHWCTQSCRGRSQVLQGARKVLSGALRCSQSYHNYSRGTPVPVIRDPSYLEGRPECPPTVWFSPEIDASKFTLRILWDTPGSFQWLNYILLMNRVGTMMPACGRYDSLDKFFHKAAASEVTHVDNTKPQQQQLQQQQQQKLHTDSSSKDGKQGYRASIAEPADTTGGKSSQLGWNNHGKSVGAGQSSGLPPAPWVSTEIFDGGRSTSKCLQCGSSNHKASFCPTFQREGKPPQQQDQTLAPTRHGEHQVKW